MANIHDDIWMCAIEPKLINDLNWPLQGLFLIREALWGFRGSDSG